MTSDNQFSKQDVASVLPDWFHRLKPITLPIICQATGFTDVFITIHDMDNLDGDEFITTKSGSTIGASVYASELSPPLSRDEDKPMVYASLQALLAELKRKCRSKLINPTEFQSDGWRAFTVAVEHGGQLHKLPLLAFCKCQGGPGFARPANWKQRHDSLVMQSLHTRPGIGQHLCFANEMKERKRTIADDDIANRNSNCKPLPPYPFASSLPHHFFA
jgi:hypothetical protein